jgi:glycosyltransferase involved in cell wall biosynthesis
MPIYNGIEFIEESVSSVISQTYTEWELLIGINGHPSGSDVYNIAKKYESDKIKVFDMEIKGKVNTLNEMVKFAKFDWIAILDVDDIWLINKLEKQVPYMDDYDVIGTKCVYFGNGSGSPDIPIGDLKSYNFLACNPVINSSSLIRKELCVWEDEFLDDYNLWLKLWRQNKRFYNINEVLVKHRLHNTSAFNSKGNDLQVFKLRAKYI